MQARPRRRKDKMLLIRSLPARSLLLFDLLSVTACSNRSLNTLTEVEEPAEKVHRLGQAPIATYPLCIQGWNMCNDKRWRLNRNVEWRN